MAEPKTKLELLASTVQVVSVVSGVVISVLSFNATRDKEAEARKIEAEMPFVELQRGIYLETAKTAAIIATPEGRSPEELLKAKRRFRELYVSELTMVEDREVEQGMIALASAVDPDLENLTPGQRAALNLAKALSSAFNSQHQGRR
ncbi:MAG TPA: hypothetical protein VIS96_07745 [Terrimicrobiaceae bacterium]